MLIVGPSVSRKATNGARIGMSRYVIVQRIPETTMAVVVERRAPKMAFLSTSSPIRRSLRTNRSAGDRDLRSLLLITDLHPSSLLHH